MGLTYYFGFDIASDASGFSLVITRGAYSYTVAAADFPTPTLHVPFTADTYLGFPAELKALLVSKAATAGDPLSADWGVVWSNAAMAYTVSHSNAWSATLTSDAQHVLGMATPLGSATTHASTVRPYYAIRPSNDSFKMTRPPSEAGRDLDEEVTDDGDGSSLGPTEYEVHCDLMQLYEPLAASESLSAAASVPWTWRHAIRHARATHPFLVVRAPNTQATITYVAADVWARLKLRGPGAKWRSEYAIARPSVVDTHRHIPLLCRVLEQLAT